MMTCHSCQAQIVAYLHGELPAQQRRLVACHLDECPFCYAAYVQQREIVQELMHAVPLIGQDHTPRLGWVWSGIQEDMSRSRRPHYPMRYGLAAFFLALALLLPWTLNSRSVVLAEPPTQPSPLLQTSERTPAVVDVEPSGTAVAVLLSMDEKPPMPDMAARVAPRLDATPAARRGA